MHKVTFIHLSLSLAQYWLTISEWSHPVTLWHARDGSISNALETFSRLIHYALKLDVIQMEDSTLRIGIVGSDPEEQANGIGQV